MGHPICLCNFIHFYIPLLTFNQDNIRKTLAKTTVDPVIMEIKTRYTVMEIKTTYTINFMRFFETHGLCKQN